MKKSIITIFFAFAISTFCFSQDFSKWQVGVTSSVGRSTYSELGDSYASEKNLNLSTGFSLTYQMRYLFFETGINYEYREHYYVGYFTKFYIYTYDYDVYSNWLNFPLEVGVRYPTKFGNPYFVIGGYYNYLTKSEAESVDLSSGERTSFTWEEFGKNQIGGQLGIGYQYAISDKWTIDLSYRIARDLKSLTRDYYTYHQTDYTAQDIALRLKYNF